MNKLIKALCLAVIFFTSGIVFSQEIITDRPDKTESVETVGKNKFQIEMGIEYTQLKLTGFSQFLTPVEFKIKTLTAPTALLRFGIIKNIELRFGFDFDRTSISVSDTTQFDNSAGLTLNAPTIGAKFEIAKGKNGLPDFSVIGAVKIPNIGDEAKQTKHFVPELILAFSNGINDRLSLGYNFGVEWSDDLEEKNFFYSASLGIEINPRLGSFLEIYGNIPPGDFTAERYVDGGFTYLIKNNIQVDLYGGLGLTDSSNDFILGTGVAFKF